jgi:hypothetical protein
MDTGVVTNQPRPSYDPSVLRTNRNAEQPAPVTQVKRAAVVPVEDWTIAEVLFWNRDAKKK